MNTKIYKTGDGRLSFDPLSLRRRLLIESGNELNSLIALYNDAADPLEALKAEDRLVAVGRAAFGLAPVTQDGGVDDATVLDYLAHFLEWLSRPVNSQSPPMSIDTPCLDCPPL